MKRKHTKRVNAVTGTVIRGTLSILFYAVVIAFVIKGARWGYQFGYDVFNGSALTAEKGPVVQYKIETDASIRTIAADLEKLGLIKDSKIMIVQKVFYDINLLPGTYELDSSMTSREMLDWMSKLTNAIAKPEDEEPETEAATEAETETQAETETASEDGGESAEGGAE